MSFDAGSITATLSVDTAKADADLAKIEARVKDLEDKPHKIKISAVFDDASLGRAKAMFAALDNSISRDAMQRLRSSPQGSVLGALNALFSPHPVTGAPSPQQAASQGMLGKIFSPQGGGSTPLPQGGGSSAAGGTSVAREVVTGQPATPQQVTQQVREQQQGATVTAPGSVTQQVREVQEGAAVQAPSETTEKVRLEADTSDLDAQSKDAASKSGDDAGKSWTGRFAAAMTGGGIMSAIGRIFGGGGGGIADTAAKSGGSAGSGFAKNFSAQLIGGIGPLILGLKVKMAAIGTAASVGLAALPALAGIIGTGMGVAMVGGLLAEVVKGNAKLKAQFTTIGTDLKNTLAAAAGPVIPAISAVLNQVPGLLKSIEPQLAGVFKVVAPQIQGIFNGLIPIVHGLVSIIQAAAPAFGPFIGAIEKLVADLLPGIAMVIKATTPVLGQFGQILGTLGSHLGQVFSAAAPAIKASMTVLGALLDAIGGLLPALVKLADVFATALAPVITQFAGVIKALTPTLTIIGGVIASLAGAILGDLVAAFTAIAQVIVGISPALKAFATAISGVFTVLENTGVFAILGDALENLAAPLAKLISALLTGLTPILPPVIQFVSQLSAMLTGALSQAITALLPPLTQLATVALQALAEVLPVILPVLTAVLGAFTGGAVTVIAGVANGFNSLLKAIPPGVLQGIAIAIGAIVGAVKLWSAAQAVLNVLLDANPVGIVIVALAAVAAGFYLAWEKSAAFRDAIKDIGAALLTFGIIVVEANKAIVNAFLDMISVILHGAADAFGWIPGLGGKLKDAAASFDDFKGHVNNAFNDTIKSMQGWQSELNGATSSAKTLAQAAQDTATVFTRQKQSADDATTSLNSYTEAIKANGVGSSQAQAARSQLITDLTNAGVKSSTAQTDVENYTLAVAQNGTTSTQAQAARQQLITDILGASNNAIRGQTDMANYTAAVRNNGSTSSAAQAARAKLIQDLENAGVSAKTANQLVNGLSTAIKNLPAGKTIQIHMDGTGLYTITGSAVAKSQGPGGSGNAAGGLAAGGYISMGSGPKADDVPIMASKGEYVVQASSVAKYGTGMMNAINAGNFASGGMVGMPTPGFTQGMYNAFQSQMTAAMVSAMRAAIKAAEAAAAAAAAGASGGKTTAGSMSPSAIAALWTSLGGPAYAAENMARIADAESGDDPSIVQQGEPPGLTGWGLYQITPTSGISQNGRFGNLLNASNNTKAAIYLFSGSGYSPWTSDPVGASLAGAAGGLIPQMMASRAGVTKFAQGGTVWEPVTGFGHRTGGVYQFAENGPETVTPGSQGGGMSADKLDRLSDQLERLIATTAQVPHGIGGQLGMAMSGAAHDASFRNRYPRAGS